MFLGYMGFQQIHGRLLPMLDRLNGFIDKAVESSLPVLNSIVSEHIRRRGKQIRPLIVVLSAELLSGKVSDDVLHAGASLEILHNASLVHDDVLDHADMRRGMPSINAVWNNHIAVLAGDFLVSRALDEALLAGSVGGAKILSRLARVLSEGELHQIFVARDRDFSIKEYFRTVEMKTAMLFECCVSMAAEAARLSSEYASALVQYARYLGLCFQIRDDMFDYEGGDDPGKPTGNDLRESKVTLPLLHALRVAPKQEADDMKAIIDSGELSESQIAMLIDFAKRYGGLEYCESIMERLRVKAMRYLNRYDDCVARRDFENLFSFVMKRSR